MAVPDGIREEVWAAMRSSRLWHDAPDADIEWLARIAQVVDYARGDFIFVEGQPAEKIAVIVDGHARSQHSEAGRTTVVETLWPGDVVGAVAALSDLAFETDIEAATPVTAALIPAGTLRDLIATEPSVALSVIGEISRRWVAAVAVNKRSSIDVASRVAHYLAELPRTRLGDTAYAVEIPYSRVELAAEINTTPETLSRAFRTLQDEGLIESHDRMIIVLDGEALISRHDGEPQRSLGR